MARKEFERLERLERLGQYQPYELSGSLEDLVDSLQSHLDKVRQNGWMRPYVEVTEYYGDCTIYVNAWRMETDEEYETRWELNKKILEKQKNAALKRAQRERATYLRLKKKYEGM